MNDPDVVLYQSNFYKPLIDKANKLTEAYVAKHKLILTGGMAIDIALRAKGSHIYSEDAIPDYDVISDQNLDHANALATILCNEGLPDINVINAVHITTVRVRMKNITFLDATYIPSSCYKKIPYLDVGELRVVHPHYQFIDQRLSLSNLLGDTGRSLNVFNRLVKDMKRNEMLREHYPIDTQLKSIKDKSTVQIPLDLIQTDHKKLSIYDENTFVYTGPVCVSGYMAMLLYMGKYTIRGDSIEVEMPGDIPISLLSCDISSVSYKFNKPKTFRPLLNLKQASIRDGRFEFIDTYGSRIGCNTIDLTSEVKVCVASVDYLLMEILRDRIYVNEEPYSFIYNELVQLADNKRLNEDRLNVKWLPSLNCYGKDDLPEYRVVMLEQIMHNSDDPFTLKPKNSYLKSEVCKTKTGFVQSDSHYFRIDGTEDDTLEHTNYKHIVEQFQKYIANQKNKD